MQWKELIALMTLVATAACGGTENESGTGGDISATGGTGGTPLSPSGEQTFELGCMRPDVSLNLEIELAVRLSERFVSGTSSDATFGPAVTLTEASTEALIDAGVESIDVTSMSVQTRLLGAEPSTMTTLLADAPLEDFDLRTDPDDDGVPGPHRFELIPITETVVPLQGANMVEFSISAVAISFGDFSVPQSCVDSQSLVGSPLSFAVASN